MKVLRVIGVIVGLGMIIPVIAPHIGWVTDWDVAPWQQKMVFAVMSGTSAGFSIAIVAWASGLLEWFIDR